MKSFYMRQKIFSIGDKYNIYDGNNNLAYYVKGQIFSFTSKLHLFSKATDNEIFFIRKKFFSFLPKYQLFKGEKVVANVAKRFTVFRHSLRIDSEYGNFDIDGDFFAYNFKISLAGEVVCELHKVWLTFGDSYEIRIYDDENYEFYIALIILIDNCIHNENDNNNN